jgi:hypothetical protein
MDTNKSILDIFHQMSNIIKSDLVERMETVQMAESVAKSMEQIASGQTESLT